jgi:RNA polymerase sigma-70 factor (ECF subfamily)
VADERGLVEAVVRGDREAFATIYRSYRAPLLQYASALVRSRGTAEDVVHDVFVGLAKQAAAGRGPREVGPFLYAAVRNRCIDLLRRRPEPSIDPADLDLIAAPAGDVERIERRQTLNRLLLSLPVEQREVVVLRTWHDLGFAAIAALQGTSINTALSRYQYALAHLRREIGDEEMGGDD